MKVNKIIKTVIVLASTVSAVMISSIVTGNDPRTEADNSVETARQNQESDGAAEQKKSDTPRLLAKAETSTRAEEVDKGYDATGKHSEEALTNRLMNARSNSTKIEPTELETIQLAQLNSSASYDNELAASKVRLEAQNEKLINQIIKYRSQIRKYEKALETRQAVVSTTFESEVENRQSSQEDRGEQVSEREYFSMKKDLERALLMKEDYLKTKQHLASATSTIERLENELEQKRGTGVNNSYLRNEVEKLRAQLGSSEEVSLKAKSLQAELNKAQAEIAKLKSDSSATIDKLIADGERASKDLQSLKNSLNENKKQETELKKQLSDQLAALKKKDIQIEDYNKKLSESQQEITSTSKQLSITIEQAKQCELAKKGDVDAKQNELVSLDKLLSSTVQEVKECRSQVESKETELARIPVLQNEIIKLKNELLLKDTEIAQLAQYSGKAGITQQRQISSLRPQQNQLPQVPLARGASSQIADPGQVFAAVAENVQSDVLIAEVISAKVNLRSGPGEEHSPVMQVQKGTRLTVESREGDWYRVLSPTGSRAYVKKDVVLTANQEQTPKSENNFSSPKSTISVPLDITSEKTTSKEAASSADNSKQEEEAFERLKAALNLRNK